jgi:hypothetical protein
MTSKTLFSATALALGALTVAATPASEPGAAVWNVDAPHSHVSFRVKHFFTPVRGQFDVFEVELAYDRERPENSTISVRIPISSINTTTRGGTSTSGPVTSSRPRPIPTSPSPPRASGRWGRTSSWSGGR